MRFSMSVASVFCLLLALACGGSGTGEFAPLVDDEGGPSGVAWDTPRADLPQLTKKAPSSTKNGVHLTGFSADPDTMEFGGVPLPVIWAFDEHDVLKVRYATSTSKHSDDAAFCKAVSASLTAQYGESTVGGATANNRVWHGQSGRVYFEHKSYPFHQCKIYWVAAGVDLFGDL